MALERLVCTWSVGSGGIGYTTFYGTQAGGAQPSFAAFWAGVKPYLNTGITVHIPNTGDVIDPTNGKKTGVWGSGTASDVVGTSPNQFSAPSGASIRWGTGAFVNGKNVHGRSYLVPLVVSAYGMDGKLLPSVATALQAAANSLWVSNGTVLRVWHRPVYTKPTDNTPPVLITPGSDYAINSCTVPTKVAILRTRRE